MSGDATGERCVGGMPPELRNHRIPTGPETPALAAASSLDKPAAAPCQNRYRFSRCHTGGRPGEDNFCRVDRSDFRLPVAIATCRFEVLRRPVESAKYVSIRYTERLAEAGIELSVGRMGDAYDNASTETMNGLYKTEVIRGRSSWKKVEDVELETLKWVNWFNNRRLLEPIGNIPPAEAKDNYYAMMAISEMAA